MHKLIALFTLALCYGSSLAQQAPPDTTRHQPGIREAITSYFQFINDGIGLYNGVEHTAYFYLIEGIAYYKALDWQNATIKYDGIEYTNIPTKYDLVKEQVIVKHPSSLGLYLYSPRVAYFIIGNDRFVYMPGEGNAAKLAPGFYQELRRGLLTALVRRIKLIQEEIQERELKRWFEVADQFFILKEGTYHHITTKASLLALIGDRKAEAKKALRKANIRYRKAPEQAILTVVDFYNQ